MALRDDLQIDELELDVELLTLWERLQALHFKLRDYTKKKYNRVNPFIEDLFEWKEKGRFFGGENVTIYDSTTITGDTKIGNNTWIGPFCSLDGNGGLTIGSFCAISAGVQILSHDTVKWALSGGKEAYEYSPVVIGDCCFLGTKSIILKGVTIGDHCLIGANAVVNRDVPAFSVIAGIPAKIIGRVEINEEKVKIIYHNQTNVD